MPYFSIIIPTYNRSKFILGTIRSVLQQDFFDFEILIINDGSTDTTHDLIHEKYHNDSRIKYFYQENSERGTARNKGIKESSGAYLIFLDSDDQLYSNHLSTLHTIITQNPLLHFLANKYELFRKDKIYSSDLNAIPEGKYGYTLFLQGNPIAINFCIKRNNPHLKLFIEDRKYSGMEDWLFLLCNLRNERIYISNKITVRLNDHNYRSMRNNKDIIQKRILATEWIKENILLSKSEIQTLEGHSDYFCSVHSYADNNRINALYYLGKVIKKIGVTSSVLGLFIKILLGYNFIQRIK